MVKVRNFHEKLENELQRLSAEIKERQARPETKEFPEREMIKQSLHIFKEEPAGEPVAPAPAAGQQNDSFLPSYLSGGNVEPNVKLEVEKLVDMVFHEGIEKAIREAKRRQPFVADAFHDALVDKLLPVLKERGIIK